MKKLDKKENLIVIVGPTAVGKTTVSIELASRLNGAIISADSRLFYRDLDIGTAKPTQEQMQKVPHYLIDVTDLDHIWSLAVFQKHVKRLIPEISQLGKLPIMVGGTGQYIRAIIEEWKIPAQKPDLDLRSAIEKWVEDVGEEGLHKRLSVVDPIAAETIDYRNARRTIRALEVVFKTGRKFSEQRTRKTSPYNVVMVGINRPREELYARVDERIEKMIADGFIEEVKGLIKGGYEKQLENISAIGYVEIAEFIKGEIALEEAIRLIKRKTRIFVRGQSNWFKLTDPRIKWFNADEQVVDQIEIYIRSRIHAR